ncbi:MAG TPA: hypothetical protein PKD51_02265 [Saprospiraceae bacterium]|nr:hypothetical protein [Saprospiraceae bacterium]
MDDSEFLIGKTVIVDLKMSAKVRIFVKSFVGGLGEKRMGKCLVYLFFLVVMFGVRINDQTSTSNSSLMALKYFNEEGSSVAFLVKCSVRSNPNCTNLSLLFLINFFLFEVKI